MPNPVQELKETVPTIGFHNGFSKTLLGNKKEGAMVNIEEIMNEISRFTDQGYR